MLRHLARRHRLAFSLVAPAALLGFWGGHAPQNAPPKQKPETAKEKYKNIKVFKDLPADQLIPIMHKFNDSLGVRCDFCHVIDANHQGWEKDEKPTKEMARKMALMTKDLNAKQKILGKQATCFMCHHGHPEPVTQPPSAPPPQR